MSGSSRYELWQLDWSAGSHRQTLEIEVGNRDDEGFLLRTMRRVAERGPIGDPLMVRIFREFSDVR